MKQNFAYPALFTHGEKDGIISPADTYELFEKAASKDKQMKVYGGSFHEVINEFCRDEAIADYIAWMNRRIEHA